jgi:hypothetical protein
MSVVQYINRKIQLATSSSTTYACWDGPHDDWQMLDSERAALSTIVSWLRPKCAIEVGVYRAGSLSVIAAHSEKVYALDIDPGCEAAIVTGFRMSSSSLALLQRFFPSC